MTAVLRVEEPSARYLVRVEPALAREFEVLATAPGGVSRLRTLILRLAVHGKLVVQDERDEPVSFVISRIRADRRTAGRLPSVAKPTEDQCRFALPFGWGWVRLDEIASTRLGKMLDKAKNTGALRQYLRNTNVQWHRFDLADIKHLRLEERELAEYRLVAGDLLVCEGGEPGRCAIWRDEAEEMYFQKALHRIRPLGGVLPEFIQLCLAHDARAGVLESYFTGATIKHFAGQELNRYAFPLPPIAEQHRIVVRVEELMKLCDALEQNGRLADEQHVRLTSTLFDALAASESAHALAENWQRVAEHFDLLLDRPEAIDALEQTILQLAVRGLLALQDPSDEHAASLRQRIHGERTRLFASGAAKREKALKPVEEDEHAFPLPCNWVWVRFDELVRADKPIAYGVLVPGPDTPEGIPFVRLADLSLECPAAQPEKSISANVDAQFARTRLEGGEILLGVVGSIGKLGVAPDTWKGANIARAICRIVPTSLVDRSYVLNLLQSEFMKARFSGDTRTLAQPTLNVGLIRECPTPLPPLAEQRRIVARVEELRRLCADLRRRLTQAREAQSALADALVAEFA